MRFKSFIKDMRATAKMQAKLNKKETECNSLEIEKTYLQQENKTLKETTDKFLKEIMSEIDNLQSINSKNILEYDKKESIQLVTNHIISKCSRFIINKL